VRDLRRRGGSARRGGGRQGPLLRAHETGRRQRRDPARSIVAYPAICAHQLTYPTREISFISYRAGKSARNRLGNVIHCCSEHSQYDPAEGARVLAGPAPQPLAAVLLEHDAPTDGLFAVGTLGGEMFSEFFARFEFKLVLEHAGSPRQPVGAAAVVEDLDDYCRQQVKC
jgi:arsenite oxidase small subunit